MTFDPAAVLGKTSKPAVAIAPTPTNRDVIVSRARAGLAANVTAQASNATFLAIPSPTNAQNAAQVRALTQTQQTLLKECSGLIRLVLSLLDDTAGT